MRTMNINCKLLFKIVPEKKLVNDKNTDLYITLLCDKRYTFD